MTVSAPTNDNWHPVNSAPYQKPVWVRNAMMDRPILATRGFANDGIVCPDQSLFTSYSDPLAAGSFFRTPRGQLVCPDEWQLVSEDE